MVCRMSACPIQFSSGGERQEIPDMFGGGNVQCCLSGHDDKVESE